MYYTRYWALQVEDTELPIVFVKRKEAIAFAEENLVGSYKLVRHDQFVGPTTKVYTVDKGRV